MRTHEMKKALGFATKAKLADRLDIYTAESDTVSDLSPARCPKCGQADGIMVRVTDDVIVGSNLVCRSCSRLTRGTRSA